MNKNEILKEQYYTSSEMSIEQRDLIIYLVSNCKDIIDSMFNKKPNGIVNRMNIEKIDNKIKVNGTIRYEDDMNKTFDGVIYIDKDNYIIDLNIERLCVKDKYKEYSTRDVFKKVDSCYSVSSYYNFLSDKVFERCINLKERVK